MSGRLYILQQLIPGGVGDISCLGNKSVILVEKQLKIEILNKPITAFIINEI
jgi:hypothetical protein